MNWELEKQKGILYAQMPEYIYQLDKTKRFIKWALSQVEKPYVACSFGKDSSVLLDLIYKIEPSIPVYCFMCEQSEMLDNYEEVISYWSSKCNVNIIEFDQSDPLKIHRMSKLSKQIKDIDSFFNGVRAEESKQRRITLRKYGKFYKLKTTGKTRICPLAWWKTKDIMAYMFSNSLPFLDTYKTTGGQGRTGTFLPNAKKETLYSALQSLKRKSVSDYNKIILKYPDLNDLLYV